MKSASEELWRAGGAEGELPEYTKLELSQVQTLLEYVENRSRSKRKLGEGAGVGQLLGIQTDLVNRMYHSGTGPRHNRGILRRTCFPLNMLAPATSWPFLKLFFIWTRLSRFSALIVLQIQIYNPPTNSTLATIWALCISCGIAASFSWSLQTFFVAPKTSWKDLVGLFSKVIKISALISTHTNFEVAARTKLLLIFVIWRDSKGLQSRNELMNTQVLK